MSDVERSATVGRNSSAFTRGGSFVPQYDRDTSAVPSGGPFVPQDDNRQCHPEVAKDPHPVATRRPLARKLWRKVFQLRLLLVDRRKYGSVVLETVAGLPIVVLPDVFNPKLLRSGEFLVQQLMHLTPGTSVLDLGSGAGAAGVLAATRGATVTALDINPAAVRCSRINALLNNVELNVRQGDLFAPVQDERFDVVLFNPPYYRGLPRNDLDHAWRSPDIIERFSEQLADHLSPGGYALMVLSSDGETPAFLQALERNGFSRTPVAVRDFLNEQMTVYRIQRC